MSTPASERFLMSAPVSDSFLMSRPVITTVAAVAVPPSGMNAAIDDITLA
jgi:hypothetical protein